MDALKKDALTSGLAPQNARRTKLSVSIAGKDVSSAVSPWLLSFEYTDHAHGKADEIRLTLHDREGYWSGPWCPAKGTAVRASILCLDWFQAGRNLSLPCGAFSVDEVEFSGPPSIVTIKAVTASTATGLREEARTKAYEATNLRTVAGEIAQRHQLALHYDGPEHSFQRTDQREESDLAFLQRLAEERGLNLKVHENRLVLFSGQTYDAKPSSVTISKTDMAKRYSFKAKSNATYKACEVAWLDPETREMRTHTYAPSGTPPSEQVLRINRRVESEAEAQQLARASLRGKNKGEIEGSIELMGHPGLVAGVIATLTGFGRFNGRVTVEEATHKVDASGGYTTSIKVRSTLSY